MTRWFNDVWIEWLRPEPSSVTPGTRLEDIKRSKDFLDSDILKWIWSNPITKEEWEKERIISVTNPNPEPNSNLPPVLDYHARVKSKTIVICSGYYCPIHELHIEMLEAARKLGDELWVIVNNNCQTAKKKNGFVFQDERARLKIVQSLKCVDKAILSCQAESDVSVSISGLCYSIFSFEYGRPDNQVIFANGGDRTTPNPAEQRVCERYGVKMVYNVGPDKTTSSTDLIEKAGKWWASKYPNVSPVFKWPRWD